MRINPWLIIAAWPIILFFGFLRIAYTQAQAKRMAGDKRAVASKEQLLSQKRNKTLFAGIGLLGLNLLLITGLGENSPGVPVALGLYISLVAPLSIFNIICVFRSMHAGFERMMFSLLEMIFYIEVILLFFACIYSYTGVESGGKVVRDLRTTLYFSATTFTTVGYGDVVPTANGRLYAAVEAFTGYAVLALTVSCITIWFSGLPDRVGRSTGSRDRRESDRKSH